MSTDPKQPKRPTQPDDIKLDGVFDDDLDADLTDAMRAHLDEPPTPAAPIPVAESPIDEELDAFSPDAPRSARDQDIVDADDAEPSRNPDHSAVMPDGDDSSLLDFDHLEDAPPTTSASAAPSLSASAPQKGGFKSPQKADPGASASKRKRLAAVAGGGIGFVGLLAIAGYSVMNMGGGTPAPASAGFQPPPAPDAIRPAEPIAPMTAGGDATQPPDAAIAVERDLSLDDLPPSDVSPMEMASDDAMQAMGDEPRVGPASAAWRDIVTEIFEPLRASLEGQIQSLTSRMDAQEQRIAGVEMAGNQWVGTVEQQMAELRQEVEELGQKQVAAQQRATERARQIAMAQADHIIDEYEINSPNGVMTNVLLTLSADSKPISADRIVQVNDKTPSGLFRASFDIPNAVVNKLPPAPKGFIGTANTRILPDVRRFIYTSDRPITASIVFNNGVIDILMAPEGHEPFLAARARREEGPMFAGRPTPMTAGGLRRQPDGSIVRVGAANLSSVAPMTSSDRAIAVVPAMTPAEIAAQANSATRTVEGWTAAAMTDRLAVIVNTRTGQRVSVMEGTIIPYVGTVMRIDPGARTVVTSLGLIKPTP